MKFKIKSDLEKSEQIREAIKNNDVKKVKEIINSGFDVNSTNKIGDTPIIMATLFGTSEIVKILLDAGADPHTKSGTGLSAEEYAKIMNKKDILDLFK